MQVYIHADPLRNFVVAVVVPSPACRREFPEVVGQVSARQPASPPAQRSNHGTAPPLLADAAMLLRALSPQSRLSRAVGPRARFCRCGRAYGAGCCCRRALTHLVHRRSPASGLPLRRTGVCVQAEWLCVQCAHALSVLAGVRACSRGRSLAPCCCPTLSSRSRTGCSRARARSTDTPSASASRLATTALAAGWPVSFAGCLPGGVRSPSAGL